jgi:TatD DNase family protein
MQIVDTHAHLCDEAFDGMVGEVLSRAARAGVRQVINVATTAASSQLALDLANQTTGMFASAGIHPNYAHQANANDFDVINSLVQHDKVVAIGETGLDRYWDDCPWEVQLANFEQHIELSVNAGLPLIIHTRDCYPEMIDVLRKHRSRYPIAGVMHSFAGTANEALQLLELGMYISFAGMLTFKKSDELRDVAKGIPMDRLLVETDSPYLSPEPFRGKRPNEPARVIHTAGVLANVHNVALIELAIATSFNAHQLFAKMTSDLLPT